MLYLINSFAYALSIILYQSTQLLIDPSLVLPAGTLALNSEWRPRSNVVIAYRPLPSFTRGALIAYTPLPSFTRGDACCEF